MGRLGHGELSQTPRAIKWREKKSVSNAAWLLSQRSHKMGTKGAPVATDKKRGRKKAEQIGVLSEPDPVVDPGPGPAQWYYCANCKTVVVRSDEKCGTCEDQLAWDGIA